MIVDKEFEALGRKRDQVATSFATSMVTTMWACIPETMGAMIDEGAT